MNDKLNSEKESLTLGEKTRREGIVGKYFKGLKKIDCAVDKIEKKF